MNWFAIHTKPRQETIAQSSLQREGLETFYPKLRQRKTIRRCRRWVVGPLFPRYLFARFDLDQSGRLARYAKGVAAIVSFGGKPAVVDDSIIHTILKHSENDIITVQPPVLKTGDLVEIQTGPFAGLQGLFERELSDSERVVILLHTLAASARLTIPRSEIERV
jgi:transcriptional antiterminator RfaH